MQSGHVVSCRIRGGDLVDDLIQCQRSGVNDAGVRRAELEQVGGHDGTGVQAHTAALQNPLTTNRNQVCRTRPCADEVHRHFCVTALTVSSHWVIGICGRQPVKPPNGSP